ncbi:DUF6493 family protein [Actinoplanes subglobosus]|uniref:DUF6493 family protein n=1 Tax=Actinoplanes subglobosus TaxID=1547892 RepID=A0ABV8J515_9ACTN
MPLTWDGIDEPFRRNDSAGLTALLLGATEQERLAFAAEVERRVRNGSGEWWARSFDPAGLFALAVIACVPTAARAATLLTRRGMREWPDISARHFLEIARARQLTWIGDLGVRLAQGLSARDAWRGDWRFAELLLLEGGTEPPVTEGVVRGWVDAVQTHSWSTPLADVLRGSPWLDLLLPSVFEIDGLGSELPSDDFGGEQMSFPVAIARLVTEGRLERQTILDATVDRLARGDRPGALRPFALLHEALAPTPAELARFAVAYSRLVGDAPSPVARIALAALRTLGQHDLVEIATVLDAGAGALTRKEKVLVRAGLTLLDETARRSPDRAGEIVETVAGAFDHPSLDIQESARMVTSRHLGHAPAEVVARLTAAMTAMTGVTQETGAGVAGETGVGGPAPASATGPPVPAVPVLPVSPVMPPSIGSAAELAEEVTALLADPSAVRWERILAALVALPPEGFGESLAPVLDRHTGVFGDRWGRLPFLGEVIRARLGHERGHVMRERLRATVRRSLTDISGGMDRSLVNTPSGILTLRVAEIAVQVAQAPVPVLLATPTEVTGSLDADVLVGRIARCEAAGVEPWQLDLQQAMLRVPRAVDAEVLARAEELTSPSGKLLAGWLRAGGMPDPVSIRFEQRSLDTDGRVVTRRVVANLESGRESGDRILLEDALVTLTRRSRPEYYVTTTYQSDVLMMVLPQHREAVAAWALTDIAALADQDGSDAALLPLLADAAGPIGPAVTLALAYGLAARHEADRVAAVDAFLGFAAGTEPFAAALGADLGDLGSDGTIKLARVAPALRDAHQAGAAATVWEVLAAALPRLLPAAPRGLPDLLELATRAATAVGARAAVPGLPDVAARGGGTRLVREAKRLQAALTR